jgi:hypothetical protein
LQAESAGSSCDPIRRLANCNLKQVILIGHSTVPYSGWSNYDGHASRAMPAIHTTQRRPLLDHDIPLGMLATDKGIRRFASNCIENR